MDNPRTRKSEARVRAAQQRRLRREIKTVEKMLALSCRERHGAVGDLCDRCEALRLYVRERIDQCPFGSGKPTCLNCQVHCFKPEMREAVRDVMRYAGPRMMKRHPVLTILHLIDGRRPAPVLKGRKESPALKRGG